MQERTPGPWAAEPNSYNDGPTVPGSWRVNHAGTRQWVASQVTGEADARLIAAAPELLAAAESADKAGRAIFGNGPIAGRGKPAAEYDALRQACIDLRAAIAKAKGSAE